MGTKKKVPKEKKTEEEVPKHSETLSLGGKGGNEFEEVGAEDEEIIGFTIYSGSSGYIDGIQPFFSGNTKCQFHGSKKGTKHIFKCSGEERITEIQIRSSEVINAMKFKTTKKESSWFGGKGGNLTSFKFEKIFGVKGRSSDFLNQIQFIIPYDGLSANKNEMILSEEVGKAFNVKDYSDVTLTINGEEIVYLHKVVLMQCPSISNLFKNGEKEISIKVDSPKHFKEMLLFLYTGQFEVNDDNYMELIEIANEYDIRTLKLAGFDFIIKGKCNAQNVCKLLQDSKGGKFKSVDPEDLVKRCMKFINENTEAVFKSDDFVHLDHDFILAMVKDDNLALDEIDIFNGCVRWAKNKRKTKEESLETYLKDILPFIRFPNIDGAELVHYVKPTNLIDQELYIRILEQQTAPEDYELINPIKEIPGRGATRFKFDIKTGGNASLFKLSSNGLTIEKTSGNGSWSNAQIYGSKKLTSGVHYWEVKINSINSDRSGTAFGLCKDPTKKQQYSYDMVIGLSGYQYNMQGNDYTQFNANDTYGCYVDFNKGKVWFFHNGKQLQSHGVVKKGTAYWPCFHIYYVPDKFTLSFPSKKPKPK
eukprot:gene7550-11873_t